MPTEVAPLDESLDCSIQKPVPVLSPWSIKHTCGQTRSGGTNFKLAPFFFADLNVIEKTESCQIFSRNPSFSKVSVVWLQYFCW
jgi:hypothetical protein